MAHRPMSKDDIGVFIRPWIKFNYHESWITKKKAINLTLDCHIPPLPQGGGFVRVYFSESL